jgi:hypothetical protein
MFSMPILPSRALVGLSVLVALLGCGESKGGVSAPLPSPPPVVPTPPPTALPGTHVPFPALTGPGQVYLSVPYNGGGFQERYVLYDNGAFTYQQANQAALLEQHAGTYTRTGSAIAMNWTPGRTGPDADRYTMIGTISDEVMTVPHTGPMLPEYDDDDWGNFPSTYYRAPT